MRNDFSFRELLQKKKLQTVLELCTHWLWTMHRMWNLFSHGCVSDWSQSSHTSPQSSYLTWARSTFHVSPTKQCMSQNLAVLLLTTSRLKLCLITEHFSFYVFHRVKAFNQKVHLVNKALKASVFSSFMLPFLSRDLSGAVQLSFKLLKMNLNAVYTNWLHFCQNCTLNYLNNKNREIHNISIKS